MKSISPPFTPLPIHPLPYPSPSQQSETSLHPFLVTSVFLNHHIYNLHIRLSSPIHLLSILFLYSFFPLLQPAHSLLFIHSSTCISFLNSHHYNLQLLPLHPFCPSPTPSPVQVPPVHSLLPRPSPTFPVTHTPWLPLTFPRLFCSSSLTRESPSLHPVNLHASKL